MAIPRSQKGEEVLDLIPCQVLYKKNIKKNIKKVAQFRVHACVNHFPFLDFESSHYLFCILVVSHSPLTLYWIGPG